MKWIERSLVAIGLALLCAWGALRLDALGFQRSAGRRLDAVQAANLPSTDRPRASAPGEGEPLGRIVIPRVGVSAVIAEGTGTGTLRRAVGHVPGTALPGEAGNSALAAHRDGLFRPLRRIRPGDEIELVTPRGRSAYRVDWARVVGPDRVDLIARTPQPAITLVTCYPWNWIGPAPRRFLVRASLVGRNGQAGVPRARSGSGG